MHFKFRVVRNNAVDVYIYITLLYLNFASNTQLGRPNKMKDASNEQNTSPSGL